MKGTTVLVTGGAGFIGSHAVEALLRRGDRVHVADDLSKGQVTNLPDGVPLHVVDIADAEQVQRLFASARFDAVVHCAAQTNVMRSIADPALDRRINVDGLRAVLEAASSQGCARLVFVSSGGAIYGETPEPASETTAPRPTNPYGRNKLEGEGLVDAAPISGVSIRPSNVYGPRQRSDAEGGVISIFAERIAAGQPVRVFGDGEQQRDFVHVSDVVSAIVLALETPSLSGVWNVGSGQATSVNELIRIMQDVFGVPVQVSREPARGEVRRSCLDVARLRRMNWRPEYSLLSGITELARSLTSASNKPG